MKLKQDCQHVFYGQWILENGEYKNYQICAKCGGRVEEK
jgi:hypothetical protein